ncbi:MAG: diguanylate cyclase [Pseudomonadales bacterium]|nr:diguanylate cyclase [Pseudomonadales bacterium]
MRLNFRNNRDILLFAGVVAAISSLASLFAVLVVYLTGGQHAFHLENAITFAGVVPMLIAVPISFWVGRTGLRLTEAQKNLRRLADTDPLTGLRNRRSFFSAASEIVASPERPCSLLVIDADHFKDLNDNYGHAVGDAALVNIAEVLRNSFRASDLTCRVGGEEFAILLPGIARDGAMVMAQRVLDSVSDSPIVAGNAIITYSVSCGIAEAEAGEALPELFKRADDAMYQAKEEGRNRVALHEAAA